MPAASDPASRFAAGAPDDPRVAAGAPVDLLVAGDAVPDVIAGDVAGEIAFGQTETLVSRGALTVGGSSAIMACGAARLGLRVAFVGVFGDDAAGRFMLEELTARGVEVSDCVVLPSRATGLTVHLVRPGADRDRAMLTSLGCVGELTAAMVRGAHAQRARHIHVSSFYLLPRLAPDLAGLFAEVRESGCTTSLDTQGDWEGRWQGGLREVLRETDLYLPNLDEARAVAASLGGEPAPASPGGKEPAQAEPSCGADSTGGPDLERVLKTLAALGTRPVVKCGAQGAAPVDTIGAGDSFDAGFVYGHLQGWPVGRSLAFAAACGSLSTRAAGGVDAQPGVAAALAALAAAAEADAGLSGR